MLVAAAPVDLARRRARHDGPVPEPTDPVKPLEVDLGKVLVWGTAAWVVALVVAVVLGATGTTGWIPTAVCATGAALGLLGVWWTTWHDRMGRRLKR